MSKTTPESDRIPAAKKSCPERIKKIRVIGGPEIKPPPDTDFQQVPFSIRGLSKLEGLHSADTVIVWPSLSILDSKEFENMLIECANALEKHVAPAKLFGLKCKCIWCELNDASVRQLLHDGYSLYGPVMKMQLHDRLPAIDRQKAFRLVVDDNDLKPMSFCAQTLQYLIAYACSHKDAVRNKNWGEYLKIHEHVSLKADICNIVSGVLIQCISAAYTGAAVAVVFPDEFKPPRKVVNMFLPRLTGMIKQLASITSEDPTLGQIVKGDRFQRFINNLGQIDTAKTKNNISRVPVSDADLENIFPYLFISNHFWLSLMIRNSWDGAGARNNHKVPTKGSSDHFIKMLAAWSVVPGHPHKTFSFHKESLTGSISDTIEGLLRDTEFFSISPRHLSPFPTETKPGVVDIPRTASAASKRKPPGKSDDDINVMVQYAPSRVDSEGHALNLVFRYGSGGFMAMPEPPSLESLLGIKTEYIPITKIEPTIERLKLRSPKFYFIVRVTLANGEIVDVPMVPITFKRFLAFCVAGLLAENNGSDGAIDVTTSKIGNHDLSDAVPPIYNEHPHKPRQSVNRAFEKKLKGKADFNIIDESPGENKYPLKPILRKIVDIATLKKRIKAAKKCDKHDDAIQKIIAVLN